MKRSEINSIIRDAETFISRFSFKLPPFACWIPEDWNLKGHDCDEIRDNMLGWDITDYGLGDFKQTGLVLVTIRNGNQKLAQYQKPYAEKLLVSQEKQLCPMHFHWYKMEDIINRGGGILMMQLYKSTPEGDLDEVSDVEVVSDGVKLRTPAGTVLELLPGQSVTLTQGLYHAFWAKEGQGPVLIGEVSQCNDDNTDNRFLKKMGRFPEIVEDEAPYRLLCTEYPTAERKQHGRC